MMNIFKLVKIDMLTSETELSEYYSTLELAKAGAPSTLDWQVEEHPRGNYLRADATESGRFGEMDFSYVIHTITLKA